MYIPSRFKEQSVDHYAVVHMRGNVKPWEFWVPDDLSGAALGRAIVGFRIHVTNTSSKFKLSQQHPEAERERVADALQRERTDEGSHKIADLMRATASVQKSK